MNNEKKDAPESGMLPSANKVSESKDSKSSEIAPKEDSVIIYYSWFAWLLTLKPLSMCARCFIALLNFAFVGKDIDENNLPAEKAAVLKTFTHTIKKNRSNRENGKKGAEFGKKGGRPPHTSGSKTPTRFQEDNPYGDNIGIPYDENRGNPTVPVPITDTNTEPVSVTGTSSKVEKKTSPHTDADFFFPVFFWRNLKSPRRQAEKFCTFYATSDWIMSGGTALKTDEQRIAAAKRWEVRDDIGGRFDVADLAMWAKLYEIAPAEIKPEMLDDKVAIHRDSSTAALTVSEKISTWIEADLENTKVIILPWKGNRYLNYIKYE